MIVANLTYQWLGPAVFIAAGVAFLLVFLHDRKHLPALRLSGAFFFTVVGFVAVMLIDGKLRPALQAAILTSLFVGHFLLVWGVTSLYGRKFPRLIFGCGVIVAASIIFYSNFYPSLFWLRVAAASGFTVFVDLICAFLVWRTRSHRVDIVVSVIFFVHAAATLNRIIRVHLAGPELVSDGAFKMSPLVSSMQTENAIFAIAIGLALFARHSVSLLMRLNRLAETDPLTGLLNRRAFDARAAVLRGASAPLPTGLIICDIDLFKRVNDTYGHDVGDTVLKTVAQLLKREAGPGSICARLGGEEFCILLPESNSEMTRLVATRLRVAIETQQIVSSGRRLNLTASFGYCELAPEDELRDAMADVDAAVYQAKADGRNLVRVATPTIAEPIRLADRSKSAV
ncbi:MAG: GGDEF domain-containing protein [Hoeflea sp.]|uniref:GGDEF domain-containing protein n=1 Tax=Hoeflea sp. TaxID=1940281 RepID=UPI00329A239B